MKTLTPAEIAAIRELEAKATPGPWFVDGSYVGTCGVSQGTSHADRGQTIDGGAGDGMTIDDASLIAAMRNALPRLLAMVEAQRPVVEAADQWEKRQGGAFAERELRFALAAFRAAAAGEGTT